MPLIQEGAFLGEGERGVWQSSGSRQAIVRGSCQAVFRQSSGSGQAVVRQWSGSRQAVVRQPSGSRQAVIKQSSGSHQTVVRQSLRIIHAVSQLNRLLA